MSKLSLEKLEEDVAEYVAELTGELDSQHVDLLKQTSVRLEFAILAQVDALAETGKVSRNTIINDALRFGLALICRELSEEQRKQHEEKVVENLRKLMQEVE